jgi:hypothetical protein
MYDLSRVAKLNASDGPTIRRIVFEKDDNDRWIATAESSAGDFVGVGATIAQAREDLDFQLKKVHAHAMLPE